MRGKLIGLVLVLLLVAGCGSGWSDAEVGLVTDYCMSVGGFDAERCPYFVSTIHAESDCDPEQAKAVIDRIFAELNGAPALSVAENYRLQGCRYVGRR